MENLIMKSSFKKAVIDYSKVKTVKDIIVVLKALDISVILRNEEIPEQFREAFEKGILKVLE